MAFKELAAIAAFATFALANPALAQTYNFESDATTSSGALTTYTATNAGLTLTLTRPGSTFDISGANGGTFGEHSLSPFNDTRATSFIASFSSLLSAFSIDFADFGADSDSFSLVVYSGANGTGSIVGTVNQSYGLGSLPGSIGTASFSGSSFQSVGFIGGSPSFPNSLYYDNLRATVASAVPEPATWAMMLFGFGAMGVTLRRRNGASGRVALAA